MVKASISGFPLVRAMLLGTTAIALFGAPFGIPDAAARVGVTSATDGDPLGKPPSEAERVLRIGIDVQANEVITTNARDRAHLVFLDGTSLTVGPNAQLTIDKFVYDPATKTGDLAINASKGVFRLVGGKISKTKPITITTPSGTIGIRGGITIFTVQPTSTTSTFVFGNGMTLTAGGQTQTVTRPGSQVTASGGAAPSAPTMVGQGGMSAQLSQLEGTSQSSGSGSSSGGAGGGSAGAGGTGGGSADQKAQSSGFSSGNSGQAPSSTQPQVNIGPTPAAQKINNSEAVANALSNNQTVQQTQQAEEMKTTAPALASTPTTTVIVTKGRLRLEPAYTNFNNQTLGVTPVTANNSTLSSTGTVTNGYATITSTDGRSFTVPWQPGAGIFAVSITHPTLGVLTGNALVGANSDFFAYSFKDLSNQSVGFVGGNPTTMAQFPTSGFATHTMTNASGSNNLAWAPSNVNGDSALRSAASQSAMYSAYGASSAPVIGQTTSTANSSNSMQTTISITGTGSSQKSYMGVFIGEYFKDFNNNTMFDSGAYNATYRLDSTGKVARASSSAATFDTGTSNSIYGPNADYMAFSPSPVSSPVTIGSGNIVTAASTTRSAAASFNQPYTDLNGSDYYSSNLAVKTTNSSTLGQTRTQQTLNGFVGGLVEQRDSSPANVPGNFTVRALGSTSASATDFVLKTDPTSNRAEATITISQFDGANTSATFTLGGINSGRSGVSSFVDDNIYAMRDRNAGTFPSSTSVTVSGNTSTGTDVTSRTFMSSYGTAPVANFFTEQGVTACDCAFMSWGWWSGEVRYNANSVYNPDGRDRLNLATYVAGTLSSVADLNTLNTQTATATYTGHLVGNVQNGANSYVAAGSYTNTWSFGPRTGIAQVTFDGATFGNSFTVNTSQPNAAVNSFSTTTPIASTGVTGRNLTLNGAFVNAPGAPAKGQIGNFAVTGTGYQAGGTFAAQKP